MEESVIPVNEKIAAKEQLASEIMELSRNILLIDLRFIEPAVMELNISPSADADTYLSDIAGIYYGFVHVLSTYRIDRKIINHELLHMILHIIFRHPFIGKNVDPLYWDLACDISVENVIAELSLPEAEDRKSDSRRQRLSEYKKLLPQLTAERIYRYLKDNKPDEETVAALRESLYADDHSLWHGRKKDSSSAEDSVTKTADSDKGDGDNIKGGGDKRKEDKDSGDTGGSDPYETAGDDKEDESRPGASMEADEKKWGDISLKIQTDLETHNKKWAEKAGSLLRNIREGNRKKPDLREFLRQFSVMGEVNRINPDEFDYIYYDYGLRLYGNIPLIEPLEYDEDKRIRSFAVVIDTSASTDGSLVQSFVNTAYNILCDEDTFFRETCIRLILCDAEVQEDIKISSRDDLLQSKEKLTLKGFGGTDFRPAFKHIDELVEAHELEELKGILYFTDGLGVFPEKMPDYKTAFVFVENADSPTDWDTITVPPWAAKLCITREEADSIA